MKVMINDVEQNFLTVSLMRPSSTNKCINSNFCYLIPSDAKEQIRLDLAKVGITGEFLYADEDKTINCIITSLKEKYRLN